MKFEIELDLPELVLDQGTDESLRQALREEAVLRLYANQRIPSAVAAKALGLTRVQFLELVCQRHIPSLFADAEGLEEDLQAIEDYRRRHQRGLTDDRFR